MLPSNQRLSRQQVAEFQNNPKIKVIFNRLGTLKYLKGTSAYQGQPNSVQPTIRSFTIVTSSKNQKKAVLRNKLRRQIYSIMRQYKGVPLTGMLFVSKYAYDMPFSEIQQHFYGLLQKTT